MARSFSLSNLYLWQFSFSEVACFASYLENLPKYLHISLLSIYLFGILPRKPFKLLWESAFFLLVWKPFSFIDLFPVGKVEASIPFVISSLKRRCSKTFLARVSQLPNLVTHSVRFVWCGRARCPFGTPEGRFGAL